MDWNADNKKDLLTGEYNGNIRIYLNTGTDANPVFSGHSLLQVGGSTFDGGNYTTVCVTDWNNDGLFDLLSGESGGKVWLLINTGTVGSPVFATKPYVQDNGVALDPGSTVCPTVVDWNRDGKKDLLVGEYQGNVFFYQNYGADAAPEFDGGVKLNAGFGQIDVGYYARPFATDINEDGVMDLIVGDSNGYLWFFEASGPLWLSDNQISDAAGGLINLKVNAGVANAGRTYLILGSASGIEPGMALPGGLVTLPLNWDAFTDLGLTLLNSPVFLNFYGSLSANGTAAARLDVPAGTGYSGAMLHFAYVLNGPFDYVSNPAAIEITD